MLSSGLPGASGDPILELGDAFAPLLLEDCGGTVVTTFPQSGNDPGMGEGGKAQTSGFAHIGGEIAAGYLPERSDQIQEPAVGTGVQQDAVPLVFEIEACGGVAPGSLEPPVELGEALELGCSRVGREPECQRLERAQDHAHFSERRGIQPPHPEPPAHAAVEDPLACQANERFTDRGPAHSQLGSELGILEPAAVGVVPPLDAVEDLAVDFIPQRRASDHALSTSKDSGFGILYTLYSADPKRKVHHRSGSPMKPATLLPVIALLTAPAPTLHAQSEAALKEHFEGRTVRVKLAMPGTEDGVDVYPGTPRPLDFSRHADRLKDYGTALRAGAEAMVTKVKVKGKLIEFQLGGGGYGTAGDQTDPSVGFTPAPKTEREKTLERDLKDVRDPVVKRRMEDELDRLRSEREREDRRNRARAAEATERRREFIQNRRLAGGSRFNLRWRDAVPASALTPEAIETALASYVDFRPPASADPPVVSLRLRKGLSIEEVEDLLGEPVRKRERMEGTLRVSTRTFERDGERVMADFVEGVLVRYEVSSD